MRGYDKVLAHLMFGMTVLTASQLMTRLPAGRREVDALINRSLKVIQSQFIETYCTHEMALSSFNHSYVKFSNLNDTCHQSRYTHGLTLIAVSD